MPIEATWLLDKRVVYFHAHGNITAQDVEAVKELQLRHHDEGIAPVHTIVDVQSPSIKIPTLNQMRQAGYTPMHPNTGWMLLRGSEKSIVTFGVSVIIQMVGSKHLKVVKSLEEVVEFLNHNDRTLHLDLDYVQEYVTSHAVTS